MFRELPGPEKAPHKDEEVTQSVTSTNINGLNPEQGIKTDTVYSLLNAPPPQHL